jgi:BlaR1 peptidase M56
MLLGFWALYRGQRRSRRIQDPQLTTQLAQLCSALRVRRPVAIYESPDLPSAATIGWRRPILLLPSEWRSWTEAQQRAALAHELAHVGRGDFAAWLLARLCVAVHFWHPLVRLLARQLQLQQELAADALAAPLAGGRSAYLRALAELALRADGRACGWAAPAFLSRPAIFLRRIAMLRVMDDRRAQPASRFGRWMTVGLLGALTLVVSAWRFPGRDALASDAPEPAAKIVPFDLTLVSRGDGEQDGVFGVRPAAFLDRPGTEPFRKLINDQLDTLTAAFTAGGFGIHIEDVEQIMGRVQFGGENKPGKRQIMLSLNVLRTTRDIDWVKLRDRCGKVFTQHQFKGETYVSFSMPDMLKGLLGGKGDSYLWAVDARTLIFDTDTAIKALIEARSDGKKLPEPEYAAGWDRVSRSLFAMALDNHNGRIVKRCVTDAERHDLEADATKVESRALRFFQEASQIVIGCAGADDFRFDLQASANSADAAAVMAEQCRGLIAAFKSIAEEPADAAHTDRAEAQERAFLLRATKHATVRQRGTHVTVHAEVSKGFSALIAAYLELPTKNER